MSTTTKKATSLRFFPQLLLAAALGVFGWRIVSTGFADVFAARNPSLAIALDASNSRAGLAHSVALLQQDAPDIIAAADTSRKVLREDPLAAGALTTLAQALEVGSTSDAAPLWRLAARSALRDLIAQTNVLEEELKQDDAEAVINRIDIILRSGAIAREGLYALLTPQLAGPKYRDAFARRLATNPPWRTSFLTHLSLNGLHSDGLTTIFAALKKSSAPPTEEELRPFLQRLIAEGQHDQAYLFWLGNLPADRKPHGDLLYNSRFQLPVSNVPFDWSFEKIPGSSIRLGRLGAARILNVDFFGAAVPFRHVRQWLLLPPGRYVFSGLQRAQALINDRGLRWKFSCAGKPTEAIAATDLISGTFPWQEFSIKFSISPECSAQELALELPARAALEQIVSGGVSFMSLSLKKDAENQSQ